MRAITISSGCHANTRKRGGSNYYLPRPYRADIDHRDSPLVDLGDAFAQRLLEVAGGLDRAGRPCAEAAADRGEIDFRIKHRGADPGVFERPFALAGDLALMLLVVAERTVVVDYSQQRDAVVHRGP